MGLDIHGHAPDRAVDLSLHSKAAGWFLITQANRHFEPSPETHEYEGPLGVPTYQFAVPGRVLQKTMDEMPPYAEVTDKGGYGLTEDDYVMAKCFLRVCIDAGCTGLTFSH
jgi:hypothetical protein